MKGYRFVTDDLKSEHGKVKWEIGKWNKLDNERQLRLCSNGFHASQKPLDSLNYNFGTRWFECEARGTILKGDDKFCATEMRLLKEIPNKVIQQFAIDCAYRVLPIYEKDYPEDARPRKALEAAQIYLDNPTKKNKDKLAAARAVAWAAARAAGAAARDAAWAAAGAAARDAAGDAAWAAGAAARDAECKWQNGHLLNLIGESK